MNILLFQMNRIFGGIKMSWEEAIKKEWDIRDIRQRREDKRGHYDRPPETNDKCVVRVCEATSCKYNSKRNCTLANVDITKDGRCKQFKPQEYMTYR